MLPKVVHILLKINFHDFCPFWVWYFCYWYPVIYWNQIGIVCWKWIVIFVMVISVPVSHEHWDATVLMILQEIKMYVYSRGLRLLGYDVASVGNWLHLRGMGSLCKALQWQVIQTIMLVAFVIHHHGLMIKDCNCSDTKTKGTLSQCKEQCIRHTDALLCVALITVKITVSVKMPKQTHSPCGWK